MCLLPITQMPIFRHHIKHEFQGILNTKCGIHMYTIYLKNLSPSYSVYNNVLCSVPILNNTLVKIFYGHLIKTH